MWITCIQRRSEKALESLAELMADTSVLKPVNKDGKGWLTFKWYLDKRKIGAFYDSLCEKEGERKVTLPEDCNDFFYCVSCYSEQKVILPFDSAFDAEFKCDCGKKLVVVDKEHAVSLYNDTKN